MRNLSGFISATIIFLSVQSATASDETRFCAQLHAAGLAERWNSQSLFYRAANNMPVQIQVRDELPKSRIDSLYYYIYSDPSEYNLPSVLNIKFVYTVEHKISRQDLVDLHNDLWDKLSEQRQTRISDDCAHITIEGYERFHLNNSRDYCLKTHFHQRSPNFDTLATIQRRESFAFGDMVGNSPPGLIALLLSIVTPGPAAASPVQFSTAPLSKVKSWIRNFKYGRQPDRCISIKPDFLQGADLVHLRITNLGTNASDSIDSRDWYLKLAK